MLFKRKKQIDRKTRFQQVAFKRELDKARGFKREARHESKYAWFTWKRFWVGVGFISIIGVAFYSLCLPNFLFIKAVAVSGQGADAAGVEVSVNRFLDEKVFYAFPRRNMLFLNTEHLQRYLIENNPAVYQISNVKKKVFSRTLELTVSPRTNRYILETSLGQLYIASNDGKVVGIKPPESPETDLVKIRVDREPQIGEKYFSDEQLSAFSAIHERFFPLLKLGFKLIDASGSTRPDLVNRGITLSPQEFIVETQPVPERKQVSFMVFFDSRSDIALALDNLRLLLNNTASERLQQLAYVDMRFRGKSFICLLNAPCEKEPPAPESSESVPGQPPPPAPAKATQNSNP